MVLNSCGECKGVSPVERQRYRSGGLMETHQNVVEAEGTDVIGRDVAVSERLRYLGDDAAFIWKDNTK